MLFWKYLGFRICACPIGRNHFQTWRKICNLNVFVLWINAQRKLQSNRQDYFRLYLTFSWLKSYKLLIRSKNREIFHCFCWEWKSLFGIALIRSGEDWGYHGVEMPAVGASSPLACSAWELPSSSSFSNNLLQLLLLLLLPHHLLLLLFLAVHGICCLLPCSTFPAPPWLLVAQNLQKKYHQSWRQHRAITSNSHLFRWHCIDTLQNWSKALIPAWNRSSNILHPLIWSPHCLLCSMTNR